MKTIMGLKKPLCICMFLCLEIGGLFPKIGGGGGSLRSTKGKQVLDGDRGKCRSRGFLFRGRKI